MKNYDIIFFDIHNCIIDNIIHFDNKKERDLHFNDLMDLSDKNGIDGNYILILANKINNKIKYYLTV
jgi:hypothetical protein